MAKKSVTAMLQVRNAKDDAAKDLTPSEYKEFLELLPAEAEGWRMELEEE